jgi:hypothetical protein
MIPVGYSAPAASFRGGHFALAYYLHAYSIAYEFVLVKSTVDKLQSSMYACGTDNNEEEIMGWLLLYADLLLTALFFYYIFKKSTGRHRKNKVTPAGFYAGWLGFLAAMFMVAVFLISAGV